MNTMHAIYLVVAAFAVAGTPLLALLCVLLRRAKKQREAMQQRILKEISRRKEEERRHAEDMRRAGDRLQEASRRIEQLAVTDDLTGLCNRRRFLEMLEHEYRRSRRTNTPVAVAMMDMDHFKVVNETYGHAFGDHVLTETGRILTAEVRTTDTVARYGGDTLVILIPDTDAEQALVVAERIRKRVAAHPVSDVHQMAEVTVSIGIGDLCSTSGTPEDLIRRADDAMDAAKQAGRNCTRTWKQVSSGQQDPALKSGAEVTQLQHQVASLSRQAKDIFIQGTWGLIRALEARDIYTRCHSENVTVYAVGIAEAMGMEPDEVAVIRRAANVHDIGKIGVSDRILLKPGPLTRDERDIMRRHVLIGVQILDQMRFLQREIPLVRHHHEFWNGHGYPDGIAGATIPLGARIMAVADALDAITSDRVYRKGVDVVRAVQILKEEAGRQFDPKAVEALIRWLREQGGLPLDPDEVAAETPQKAATAAAQ